MLSTMVIVDLDNNEEHSAVSPSTVFSLNKRARLEEPDWPRIVDTLDVRNEGVRHALRSVPREQFVPSRFQHLMYQPIPIPIGYNRHLESVHDIAKLIDMADISPMDRLLEVGTGSGYQTALLSLLLSNDNNILMSIDENEAFVEEAIDRLHNDMNLRHVSILHTDDEAWRAGQDKYDVIVYSCITHSVPESIMNRLAMNGRLLAPIIGNLMTGERQILRITKTPNCIVQELL